MLETQFGNGKQRSISPGFPRVTKGSWDWGGGAVEEFVAKEAKSDRTL